MEILKLNSSHKNSAEYLFYMNDKFMGLKMNYLNDNQRELQYRYFCDSYLSDLTVYHAYGIVEENEVKAYISFYESVEEPSWYFTTFRSDGEVDPRPLFDMVLKHNEEKGRYKFYSIMNAKHANKESWRKLFFSEDARTRYDYFDEYLVPAQHKVIYGAHFELLYNRTLPQVDTITRCTFLKKEFRESFPIAGLQ